MKYHAVFRAIIYIMYQDIRINISFLWIAVYVNLWKAQRNEK